MEILSTNAEETKALARRISENLKPGNVLALYGDLGSGKTTFTRYLADTLGIVSRVQSPTFVLMRKYHGGLGAIKGINHFDLYRLENTEDLSELSLLEHFEESNYITVIEWPELAEKLLPANCIKIGFEFISENTRRIILNGLNL